MRDPKPDELGGPPTVAKPMPWEDPALPLWQRFAGTLRSAFSPLRSLPPVILGPVGPALWFALLTAAPFMLAWGAVPFTATVMFGPTFSVSISHDSSQLPVWLDVLRAMAIGGAVSLVALLSWAVPFASLLRAFAGAPWAAANARQAASRLALYRAWLVPWASTAYFLLVWAASAETVPVVSSLAMFAFFVVPHMLILVSCQGMAMAFGASPFGAIVVAFVPTVVQWAVGRTALHFAVQVLPKTAEAL